MTMIRPAVPLALLLFLSACVARYELVSPAASVAVARNSMLVSPSSAWNRVPRTPSDVPEEENWTANGPLLDMVTFIGGVADGRPIVKQRRREQARVPIYQSGMSPQDLVSMIESFYRIRGVVTVFQVTGVQPVQFLGTQATRLDFDYVAGSAADQIRRRGRVVMATVGGRLYLIALDAARSHYFDAAAPEFDRLVAEARIRS